MGTETEWFGEPRREAVVVVDHDTGWPALFERAKGLLRGALGPTAVHIAHVGSTAVPGLCAKAVIDVQVSVPNVTDEDAYRPSIEGLGYPLRARQPDHRFFRSPPHAVPFVHVHVCTAGSDWERRHLLFVDYLKAHPDRAEEYGRLKKELAGRFENDREAYTDAKDDFIAETLNLAQPWAESERWTPSTDE
ncbi:MAG: GrpB family protein [Actinomycetota bacterium]